MFDTCLYYFAKLMLPGLTYPETPKQYQRPVFGKTIDCYESREITKSDD